MKRILIGLAASAVMVSTSAGAFASAKLDTMDNNSPSHSGAMQLAQNGGSTGTGVGGTGTGGASAGNTQGGAGAIQNPDEQLIGSKRKPETDVGTAGSGSGAATGTTTSGTPDASQSKRTGDAEPEKSGSK